MSTRVTREHQRQLEEVATILEQQLVLAKVKGMRLDPINLAILHDCVIEIRAVARVGKGAAILPATPQHKAQHDA